VEHRTGNSSHRRHTAAIGLSIGIGGVILLVLLLSLGLTAVAAPSQTIWYVRPDGSDEGTGSLLLPFGTIQHAVNVATDGDTILVAAGTYTENLNITETLTLRGGYAISGTVWLPPGTLVLPGVEATVIDGSGVVSQPVIIIQDIAGSVLLEGFIVTGGYAWDTGGGGGISAGGTPEVTIRNCIIRGNRGPEQGSGGVAGNNLIIIDSFIVDNQIVSDAPPGDTAGAGGVRANDVVMINTLVGDNHGDAGIHVNGDLTLVNVTVANNDGDVIFNPLLTATLGITNSIIYDNAPIHLSQCPTGGDCTVNYSDIEGGWSGGIGNISADPQFMDAANGDYHLRVSSPCIDAGTPVGAPPADIEGTPRDDSPDMGAYEWTGFHIFLPLVMRNV
jgi:hypothetical protein